MMDERGHERIPDDEAAELYRLAQAHALLRWQKAGEHKVSPIGPDGKITPSDDDIVAAERDWIDGARERWRKKKQRQ